MKRKLIIIFLDLILNIMLVSVGLYRVVVYLFQSIASALFASFLVVYLVGIIIELSSFNNSLSLSSVFLYIVILLLLLIVVLLSIVVFSKFVGSFIINKEKVSNGDISKYILICSLNTGTIIFVAFVLVLIWKVIFTEHFVHLKFRTVLGIADLAFNVTMVMLDNILKSILFDFFEIFEISITNYKPTSTFERFLLFVVRLIITLTVANYVFRMLNFSRFPYPQDNQKGN